MLRMAAMAHSPAEAARKTSEVSWVSAQVKWPRYKSVLIIGTRQTAIHTMAGTHTNSVRRQA